MGFRWSGGKKVRREAIPILWEAQEGRCKHCEVLMNTIPGDPAQATVDHIISVSPSDKRARDIANFQLLCRTCHQKKDSPGDVGRAKKSKKKAEKREHKIALASWEDEGGFIPDLDSD